MRIVLPAVTLQLFPIQKPHSDLTDELSEPLTGLNNSIGGIGGQGPRN
jgi:hypothetical protein